MRTMTKLVLGTSCLFVGTYGCRQVIGWEEATYWGDGGAAGAGESSSSSSSSSGGGMAGAAGSAGNAGAGGMGGGGMGGSGGAPPECVTAMDCPAQPNADLTCTNGVCGFTCKTGFGDCTTAAGCETVLTDNRNNCGMCGNACVAYCTGTTCNDPVSIAGGYHHHCAILKNGDVYCWGRNEKGELGDGTLASKSVPTKVKGLPGPAVQVDGGASASTGTYTARTCAALASGELWCWGDGNGTPSKVNGLSGIKQVSVGNTHTCVVTAIGTLYCWGGNVSGQVGDGSNAYVPTPKQIANSISSVCSGGQHSCSIGSSGSVYCWGSNGSGQLGIGSKFDKLSPTALTGIANSSDIQCGDNFTCGISGTQVYCWGGNQFAQLGTGNLSDQVSPTLIDVQGAVVLDVGFNFGGAGTSSAVYMWGYNGVGQLGTGTTTTAYIPQNVGMPEVQILRLASNSTCAILKNGEVRCWGANSYGQLGNGGNQQQVLPQLVSWP